MYTTVREKLSDRKQPSVWGYNCRSLILDIGGIYDNRHVLSYVVGLIPLQILVNRTAANDIPTSHMDFSELIFT
jgi:hypothetical protein